MLRVVQIVKKLNNTELGKGGTHDTYVLIPNDLSVSDVFDEPNIPIEFYDKTNGTMVKLRNTVGREKRIVGLGQYYRDNNLFAGDEIIFERAEIGGNTNYYVSVQKYNDSLVLQKSKYGFEILTPERLEYFRESCQFIDNSVEVNFVTSEKKRNDSPEETLFYDVVIDGESLADKCNGKEIKELLLTGNKLRINSFYGWKKYVFEMED